MCPDHAVLSAYCDHELGKELEDRISSHIAECPACRRKESEFSQVRDLMKTEEEMKLLRNKEYIKTRVFEYAAVKSRRNLMKQRIMIPVPLAVAAVALVCFLVGGSTFLAVNRNHQLRMAEEVNSKKVEIQEEELALLKQLLESDDVVVQVNMQIPEQKEIKIIGEPQILTQEQRVHFIGENE